jgi:hypothetical protein
MDQTHMLMQSHPHSHAAQKLFAHCRNRVQTLGMGFIGAKFFFKREVDAERDQSRGNKQ